MTEALVGVGAARRRASGPAAGLVDLAAGGGGQPDPAGHRPRRAAPRREADRGRPRHRPAGESPDRPGSARATRRRRDCSPPSRTGVCASPRSTPPRSATSPQTRLALDRLAIQAITGRRDRSPDGCPPPGLARVRGHGRRPGSGRPARRAPRLPPGHLVGLGERPARPALARHRSPHDDRAGRGPAGAAQPGTLPPDPRRAGRRHRGPRPRPRRGRAPGAHGGHRRGADRALSSRRRTTTKERGRIREGPGHRHRPGRRRRGVSRCPNAGTT